MTWDPNTHAGSKFMKRPWLNDTQDGFDRNKSVIHFGLKIYVEPLNIQFDHDAYLATWLKLYSVICSRDAVVLMEDNEAEYAHLAVSEWCLWKIIDK